MNLTLQEQHGEQSTSQEAQVIKLLLEASRWSRFRAQSSVTESWKILNMFLYIGKYRDLKLR